MQELCLQALTCSCALARFEAAAETSLGTLNVLVPAGGDMMAPEAPSDRPSFAAALDGDGESEVLKWAN